MAGSISRLIDPAVTNPASFISDRLQTVPVHARKLFAVIVRQAYHGPIHPKPEGIATPPEILEACGLDVGEFYDMLTMLREAGLIRISNAYPFEEIQLSPEASAAEALTGQYRDENTSWEKVLGNPALPSDSDS